MLVDRNRLVDPHMTLCSLISRPDRLNGTTVHAPLHNGTVISHPTTYKGQLHAVSSTTSLSISSSPCSPLLPSLLRRPSSLAARQPSEWPSSRDAMVNKACM